MKWASAMVEGLDLTTALDACAAQVARDLGPDAPASLAVVFASASYFNGAAQAPQLLKAYFPNAVIFGGSAGGVIGAGREVEIHSAVSLTAGYLPNVRIAPFHVTQERCPSGDDPPDAWIRATGVRPEENPSFLLLIDPFTPPSEEFISGLDFAFPNAPKAGGLASGGRGPGAHWLYLGSQALREGAIGVALVGDVALDTVVAQGCKPIGEPLRVTACEENVLRAVDGEPPIHYLRKLYTKVPPHDQQLLSSNLLLGVAVKPHLSLSDGPVGDYLIRNIVGADQERGSLAISELLHESQVVQFHVRDATSSENDLHRQVARYLRASKGKSPIQGALLFQCNGRGVGLYRQPDHDTAMFRQLAGPISVGGFFCNREIGQVGGSTYLHGFTSSFAIFRKPSASL